MQKTWTKTHKEMPIKQSGTSSRRKRSECAAIKMSAGKPQQYKQRKKSIPKTYTRARPNNFNEERDQ